MRTLCDVCESAPAILFCAADEAALCRACDDKVHKCNKLASRHVRVGLADPSEVPRCDICESAPAFFYCEIDGSSLCLQCDMIVHVGGKRTHVRYLLLRQKIEFPGDKTNHNEDMAMQSKPTENHKEQNLTTRHIVDNKIQNTRVSSAAILDGKTDGPSDMDTKMIDLNSRPRRTTHGQPSNSQAQGPDASSNSNEGASVVPVGPFRRDAEK